MVAEWNEPHSELSSKQIIAAAKKAMGVENDPATDATLQWHRFPLSWVARDQREREERKHGLEEAQNILRDVQLANDNVASPEMLALGITPQSD